MEENTIYWKVKEQSSEVRGFSECLNQHSEDSKAAASTKNQLVKLLNNQGYTVSAATFLKTKLDLIGVMVSGEVKEYFDILVTYVELLQKYLNVYVCLGKKPYDKTLFLLELNPDNQVVAIKVLLREIEDIEGYQYYLRTLLLKLFNMINGYSSKLTFRTVHTVSTAPSKIPIYLNLLNKDDDLFIMHDGKTNLLTGKFDRVLTPDLLPLALPSICRLTPVMARLISFR